MSWFALDNESWWQDEPNTWPRCFVRLYLRRVTADVLATPWSLWEGWR